MCRVGRAGGTVDDSLQGDRNRGFALKSRSISATMTHSSAKCLAVASVDLCSCRFNGRMDDKKKRLMRSVRLLQRSLNRHAHAANVDEERLTGGALAHSSNAVLSCSDLVDTLTTESLRAVQSSALRFRSVVLLIINVERRRAQAGWRAAAACGEVASTG